MKNPLTKDQAKKLMDRRKDVSRMAALIDAYTSEQSCACEHDMDTDNCYVCALLSIAFDLKQLTGTLGICLDSALEEKEFPEYTEYVP